MEEGALDIRAELQDISQAQDVCTDLCQPSFVLTFADGSSSSGSSMSHADVVVDATGVDPCLPCVPSEQQTKPFLWQLVQDGIYSPSIAGSSFSSLQWAVFKSGPMLFQ